MAIESTTHTILDDDGAPHEYRIHPHKAEEGFKLATDLFGVLGPSLGGLLDSVGAASVSDMLSANVDLGGVVRGLAESLAASDSPALARRLLQHAVRDKVPMRDRLAFECYAANYGELAEALALAVEVNRFVGFFVRLMRRGLAAGTPTGASPDAS